MLNTLKTTSHLFYITPLSLSSDNSWSEVKWSEVKWSGVKWSGADGCRAQTADRVRKFVCEKTTVFTGKCDWLSDEPVIREEGRLRSHFTSKPGKNLFLTSPYEICTEIKHLMWILIIIVLPEISKKGFEAERTRFSHQLVNGLI